MGSFPCSWEEVLKKPGGEKWLDVYDESVVNTHQGDWRDRSRQQQNLLEVQNVLLFYSELHRTLKDRGMLS